MFKIFIDKLSHKYNIKSEDLRKDLMPMFDYLKKNKKYQIDSVNRCEAITRKGCRCSRRKKKNDNYCGIHMDSFVNNNDEYLETWIDDDLGSKYLIDSNNYVYTNNEKSPVIIGVKTSDGKINQFSLKSLSSY